MANTQTTVPLFVANTVLTAATQNISAATGVPVFATTVTRDAAFGGSNKALAEGQLCYIEASDVVQYYTGSAWATVGPNSAPTSRIFLVTQNGYGSSSTAILRYSTAVVNSGSDITYADSASLGTTFTINTTGMYAMSMWNCLQISYDLDLAFSLNSTQLTTRPLSLTASTRLALVFLQGSATEAQIITCSASFYLTAGDVIRPVAVPGRTPFDTSRCGVMIARMA